MSNLSSKVAYLKCQVSTAYVDSWNMLNFCFHVYAQNWHIYVKCQVSSVKCQVSNVKCQMSSVKCQVSNGQVDPNLLFN